MLPADLPELASCHERIRPLPQSQCLMLENFLALVTAPVALGVPDTVVFALPEHLPGPGSVRPGRNKLDNRVQGSLGPHCVHHRETILGACSVQAARVCPLGREGYRTSLIQHLADQGPSHNSQPQARWPTAR